jgi:hypothetical protein
MLAEPLLVDPDPFPLFPICTLGPVSAETPEATLLFAETPDEVSTPAFPVAIVVSPTLPDPLEDPDVSPAAGGGVDWSPDVFPGAEAGGLSVLPELS